MNDTQLSDQRNNLVDQAAQATDHAIRATQRVANDALDGLAGSVQGVRHDVAPMLDRAGERASALAQRGVSALRETSRDMRDGAVRVGDRTALYVKDEPLKAILIAAASGAALMALVGLLTRSRNRA